MNGSSLTFAPDCTEAGNVCNATSSYGSDAGGSYWTWTANRNRGGGFWIDTNSSVGNTFSVAFKISFKETDCYRTIIDFSDGASDNHLYFCDGLQFYPRAGSAENFSADTVYEILISRLENGKIVAYKLDGNGQAIQILEIDDYPPSQRSLIIPANTNSGGSRFRFFHDDGGEYTTEGKVYDVRIWSNRVLPPEQFGSANAATTTTTTTTVPAVTTTAAPALDIVVVAPSSSVVPVSTVPVRQSQIPLISGSAKSTSTSVAPLGSTTTTVPAKTTGTVAPKAPSAPSVVAGSAAIKIGGKTETATVERADNQLVVSAGALKAVVGGLNPDGSQMSLDNDGSVRLNTGDTIRIKLSGFKPNAMMQAWLFSAPMLLGTTKVGSDGTVTGTFVIPKNVPEGAHRVVVVAQTTDGKPATLAVGINVGEWDSGPGVAIWLIMLPIASAVVGALLVPARRRRRASEEM